MFLEKSCDMNECNELNKYEECRKLTKRKIKFYKKEINSIQNYTSKIDSEDIKYRIEDILHWYIRKATFNKRLFYILSISLVLINASIPVINQINSEYSSIAVTLISSIATVITSALTLFTMKESWFRYRNHAELIKRECSLFNGAIGIYSKECSEKHLLLQIEQIAGQERIIWEEDKRRTTKESKESGGSNEQQV